MRGSAGWLFAGVVATTFAGCLISPKDYPLEINSPTAGARGGEAGEAGNDSGMSGASTNGGASGRSGVGGRVASGGVPTAGSINAAAASGRNVDTTSGGYRSDDAGGAGEISAAGSTGDATPPSCVGLPSTCGPNGDENCCASSVIPSGMFNRADDPSFPAKVSDFRLDVYEVTVGRFRNFAAAFDAGWRPAAGAGKNPGNAADAGWEDGWPLPSDMTSSVLCDAMYQTWTAGNDNRPQNCLSWYVAYAFCAWDDGRLPTEAEWEYAAAGGNEQRPYPWGSTEPGPDATLAVHDCRYDGSGTCSGSTNIAPVGSAPAGNGRWGQADMVGNLWEWVVDWYAGYPSSCNDCANLTDFASTSYRMSRGGCFGCDASYLVTSYRNYGTPSMGSALLATRCARAR